MASMDTMFRRPTRLQQYSLGMTIVGTVLILVVMMFGGTGRPALDYGILAAIAATIAGVLSDRATGDAVRRALHVAQGIGLVVMGIALVALLFS